MKAVNSLDLQPDRQSLSACSTEQRSKERPHINSKIGQQQSGGFLTIRNAWMEGRAPLPTDPVSIFETNFNNLLGVMLGSRTNILTDTGKSDVRPVTIINKQSGKALETENDSPSHSPRTRQVTRSGEPNQLWFIKRANFRKYTAVPAEIFRQAHRYWPSFLRFPFSGYSIIAAHGGLCLAVLNSLTAETDRLHDFPVVGQNSHLWSLVPDQNGYNFIVNLCSGRVLDVLDGSLKNYAPVHQYPFNGTDSQRWQLLA
jgi:Ricin-type beta-trefoil lectin domain-like